MRLAILLLFLSLSATAASLLDEIGRPDLGRTPAEVLGRLGSPDKDGSTVEDHEVVSAFVARLGDKHGRGKPLNPQEAVVYGLWCLDGTIHANGLDNVPIEIAAIEWRGVLTAGAKEMGLAKTAAWLTELERLVPPLAAGPAGETDVERGSRIHEHLEALFTRAETKAALDKLEDAWTDEREDGFETRLCAFIRSHLATFSF